MYTLLMSWIAMFWVGLPILLIGLVARWRKRFYLLPLAVVLALPAAEFFLWLPAWRDALAAECEPREAVPLPTPRKIARVRPVLMAPRLDARLLRELYDLYDEVHLTNPRVDPSYPYVRLERRPIQEYLCRRNEGLDYVSDGHFDGKPDDTCLRLIPIASSDAVSFQVLALDLPAVGPLWAVQWWRTRLVLIDGVPVGSGRSILRPVPLLTLSHGDETVTSVLYCNLTPGFSTKLTDWLQPY